jgi:hypothetical protein
MSKVCSKCKIEKDESEFYRNGNKLHSRCKICDLEYKKEYDSKNKDKRAKYIAANRERITAKHREWRKNNPDKVDAMMEKRRTQLNSLKTPCVKCGESRPWVIQFHHKNPADKLYNIATTILNGGRTAENVKEEVDKCVCLCSNCHDEFHWFYGKSPENPVDALNEYLSKPL